MTNFAGARVIRCSPSSAGPALLTTKSTSFNLLRGSLSGPAGNVKPLPSLRAPSMTAISISLPRA